ncbi:DUF6366 family protein [Bacillus daqingensis]|uniref:DUF6366 family protein n=1 Tax=Bacillus daqingensis TaxID=872396 RepID=A0ABV9NUZ9_9BACI
MKDHRDEQEKQVNEERKNHPGGNAADSFDRAKTGSMQGISWKAMLGIIAVLILILLLI